MLRREDYLMIEDQHRQGRYQIDIAAELGVHPRTVRRALARGGAPSGKRPGARGSKLDAYKPTVDRMLGREIWNAEVILRAIRAEGYDGGRTILWDYIRPKRPLRASKATLRFETAPGAQLQHDWTEVRVVLAGVPTKVQVALAVLGYSRRFHAWAAPCADAEHTYESLVRAFAHFGGVPAVVVVDNQKAAVVGRGGGETQFHPRFRELARHYGFTPWACRPYRARTKGKVERLAQYVQGDFFAGTPAFESLDHLNHCLEAWLADVADRRCHGTHGQVVAERFATEAPSLAALPRVAFDTAYLEHRQVGWDGYVAVRGNRYSVPAALCGQTVRIRVTLDGQLSVYGADGRCAAEHVLVDARAGWQTQGDHHAPLWAALAVEQRPLAAYAEVAP